jgi:formate hydrogenlyase subunit 3/multisubunit Na+/H+ antiporter MnhD subunit
VVLGLLGAGAMLWGSVQALRAARLKLVVAYSTVAQIGLIVLAFAVTGELGARTAWQGAIYLMLAHAVAKAAMFLAVGRIVAHVGHDDIARLDESAVRPGIAQVAFALAAISLVGLPPSGGFVGKWLLLEGTLVSGAWAWTALIAVGTLLTAAYFLRAMAGFLRTDRIDLATIVRPAWTRADLAPIALAVLAAVLGLMASGPLTLLAVDAATAHPGDL